MNHIVQILALGAGAAAGSLALASVAESLPAFAKGPTAGAVTAGVFMGAGAYLALQLVK